MKRRRPITAALVFIMIVLAFLSPPRVRGFIVVHDALKAIEDNIAHYAKMLKLAEIIETIRTIKRIEQETKEFFRNIYAAIKGNQLVSAKDMLWMILHSTYLMDKFKNDPWWRLWQTDIDLADVFPELLDFSYITGSYLYKNRPEHREYADKMIASMKEKIQEMENLREHLKLMRSAYRKHIMQVNLFTNRLYEFSRGNHVGKLIALIANLELMNARLNLTLNFNRRVMMTLLLKQETWNMVNYNRAVNRSVRSKKQ
ncbi:MAG: hypothetical protein KAW12_23900 [Candidatus Aminicenantes bacterium]|nr:hypothetical protein [Candidatus Aminicenantes bacterium]